MRFLIIHGSMSSPDSNWFPPLKEKLELLNQDVLVPRFPIEDFNELTKLGKNYVCKKQTLDNWLAVFESEVVPWVKDEPVVIIAHSLGPVFTLHALSKYKLNVDAAIFVSPFLNLDVSVGAWQVHLANKTFYKEDFDFENLRNIIPVSYVLYSENDPYIDTKYAKEFANNLGSSIVLVRGAKHMNSEVNMNEFPLVLELGKSRINLTLYQKYLAYLNEYHPTDFLKHGEMKSLTLPFGKLAAEEGIFHFRNLSKSGFCTLPIYNVAKITTEQAEYMEEGRKTASRGVPIDRVYIFRSKEDMKNKLVLKTMRKDAKAGIGVYYLFANEVNIPADKIDFGVWDESYVCTVTQEDDRTVVNMDSSSERLKEADEYKKMILKKARRWHENAVQVLND